MRKLILSLFHSAITRQTLIFLLTAQNILGIGIIFSNPLPFPPKTSIGMLTGIMLLVIVCVILLWKKRLIVFNKKPLVSDWLVVGFLIVSALSLVVSPYIFDLTSFRLLVVAVVQYAGVRLLVFTEKEKKQMIFAVGIFTLLIAAVSLFQIVFRDQAIVFAKRFLFGDSSFSIAQDLARGRGPQWGAIVISFPFFIGSLYFLRKRISTPYRLYRVLGMVLIPFSFIVSNFRWLTLCFFVGVISYTAILFRNRLVSLDKLKKIVVPFALAISGGILLASAVFHYNLIDRFLFKVKERDVTYTAGRLFLYQQALSAFVASPLLGIGSGNYRYAVERPPRLHYYQIITEEGSVDIEKRESVSSHNDLLTLLAENGIFGLLLYGVLNYSVVSRLIAVLKKSMKMKRKNEVLYSATLLISLGMFYLIGIFENSAPNNFIFVYFLYAAAVTWPAGDESGSLTLKS